MENEIWKDIKRFERLYQISNFGRVKSLKSSYKKFKNKNNIMIPQLSRKRNPYYTINLKKGMKITPIKIHRLVATHFDIQNNIPRVGHISHPVINHIDGNSLNNHHDNLEWCTQSYNVKHAINRGTHFLAKGELNGSSKLKCNEVIKIRELWQTGEYTKTKLGKLFGVSRVQISRIINFVSWRDI